MNWKVGARNVSRTHNKITDHVIKCVNFNLKIYLYLMNHYYLFKNY